MTYLDTNILIRLLTSDVPELRQQAVSRLESAALREFFIADVVFCELFFILENNPRYLLTRGDVCNRLQSLLNLPAFDYSAEFKAAYDIAKVHANLDFTDCLLAAYSDSKQNNLYTFDKNLMKILS